MKSEQEILDRIHEEVLRLSQYTLHSTVMRASITRGWIDALEWVLGRDE